MRNVVVPVPLRPLVLASAWARWHLFLWSLVLNLVWAAWGLDWVQGNGFRQAAVQPGTPGKTGFTLLSPEITGVQFTNLVTQQRYVTNQIYLNGCGVAAGDVDGDGRCDLYFCSVDRPNALYRNLGDWRFEDVTVRSGVDMTNMDSSGCSFADIDGDGDLDLVVNTVGNGTHVFLNDGKGHFTDLTLQVPLNLMKAGMSLALADIDGDGDLDLYVANYRTTTLRDMPNTQLRISEVNGEFVVQAVNGRPVTEADLVGRFKLEKNGKILENGEADVLYLNDGNGHFTLMPFLGGGFLDENGKPLREPPFDWGLTVAFRDLNGDGAPDLYVCNDFESPDRIWLNDGRGRFQLAPKLALRCTSIFSMGVDFADLDRDGFDEVFVSDMLSRSHAKRMLENGEIQPVNLPPGVIDNRPQYSHNTLLYNRGDGTYAEIAQFAGVEASEWTWSPNFLDVDLDGYEDLLITTGHELQMMNSDIINKAEEMKGQKQMSSSELQRLRTMFPRYVLPNVAFRNRGDLTFEDVSHAWGFDHPDVGNGVALADLDQDGDLDLVINNLNGPAEFYRNDGVAPRIAVRLRGKAPNTQGIGAKIKVLGGPVALQSQELMCGGRYLSGSDAVRTFAAGTLTNQLFVEVTWRSGKRTRIGPVTANAVYEIEEVSAPSLELVSKPEPTPALFREVALNLEGVRHVDEPFDDFVRQPLLPRKLSQLGPGLAWGDFNGDGWEDWVMGSGKGGALVVLENDRKGGFRKVTNTALERLVGRDLTGIVASGPVILAGSSNYQDGTTNGGCIRIHDLQRGASGESILGQRITAGPLAFADVDGDGDLDLFVGGRTVPGRYPEPADSLLLIKENERLVPGQRFEKLGLVSGAVFSDLDDDGHPELVLACEWGPIRVFKRSGTSWKEMTRELGLEPFCGWWGGVATGDLDGDGRMDIVAGNWGLNSRYRPTPEQPSRLYYGDLHENGSVDLIEAGFDPATGKEVPLRGLRTILESMPFVQETISSYDAYGKASLQEVYGERLRHAKRVEATALASMAFLRRGDHFEAQPLPREAQWAPAMGVIVADFDGDGLEDVFLSQNFFAVNGDEWRQDAGRGLLLKGDGKGGLSSMSGDRSGVKVYGEQRGCAVADYDHDGRLDLVVSQNGNVPVLYRNETAKPGLRVRLVGPPGNLTGVGARIRFHSGDRVGSAREVQAGSGYWSQNAAVQVFAQPAGDSKIWVRWPGGKETLSPIPGQAREITVAMDGKVVATP